MIKTIKHLPVEFQDTASGIRNVDRYFQRRRHMRLDATGWLIWGFVAGVLLTNAIWLGSYFHGHH